MSLEAMIFALNSGSSSALAQDLACYWKLDGDLMDSVGNNDAIDSIGVNFAPGKIGSCVNFGGFSDLLLPYNPHEGTGSFSIFCWINNPGGSMCSIISYGAATPPAEGFFFGLDPDNTLMLYGNAGPITKSDMNAPLSTWAFVGFVFDEATSTAQLYINGTASGDPGEFHPNVIGGSPTIASVAGGFFFPGCIDELGVWTKALSAEQIAELYNAGNGTTYPF